MTDEEVLRVVARHCGFSYEFANAAGTLRLGEHHVWREGGVWHVALGGRGDVLATERSREGALSRAARLEFERRLVAAMTTIGTGR